MAEVQNTQGETETVDDKSLTTQIAAESRSSASRSPWQTFVARTVTPLTLQTMLKDAANWSPERLMQYAQEVEERDPHYRSVLSTRKMAVVGLPWTVTPASEDARDIEIADFVTSAISGSGFAGLVMDLMDGVSKGYSVCEVVWKLSDGKLVPNRYLWIDQKGLTFDSETQTEIQLRTETAAFDGIPLQPAKFVAHSPKLKSGKVARSGLIFTVAALYLMKSYVTKDWLAFSEIFGMPMRYAKAIGALGEDEKAEVFRALQSLSSNATAIFGQNVEVEFMGVNTTSHGDFYEKAVRFWNQETSKVTLGQTMTSEDGASLAQAKVHDGVRIDIRNSDARMLESTINDQLVSAIVDINFGIDASRPAFSFDIEEQEDLTALSDSLVKLSAIGLKIPAAYAYEKFSIPQPEEGDEILKTSAPAAEPSDDDPPPGETLPEDEEDEALSALAAARALDVPVTKVFAMARAVGLTTYRDRKGRRRFPAADVERLAEVRAAPPFAVTATE